MMSFMREQGRGEPSGQKPPHLSCNEAEKPRSDALEKTQAGACPQTQQDAPGTQQEYLAVEARNKNVRRSTMLLAVIFILGVLSLWFMIKKSSPQTAAASQKQPGIEGARIEMAIAQLVGGRSEMFGRMDEIVKKFYEFSDVRQVKAEELMKNPFKHEVLLGDLKEQSDAEKGDFDINAQMRQEQLKQQIKSMQLLSIMKTGTNNCCMIDDKILYEGDSIKGFDVRKIGDNTVLLESDGVEVILKLSE
ncbi:MAG: hypothetical protein PHY02_05095 [Phycisphaerae bacterium]|nr:hypothetical protein [Phycisphaerae bacterium]